MKNTKTFYSKVESAAIMHGCMYKHIPDGIMIYTPDDQRERFSAAAAAIDRIKASRVERDPYTMTIRVYHETDYKLHREKIKKTNMLVDYFFEALRKVSGDQDAAKKMQYEFASNIDALNEFNAIYA